MAGINQGRPELAVGEPIRLGDNNDFEIEQHPVSDRLIIRDTQNGKVAYVRKERGGEIGGDGVLIKALKEGKPMADTGRTYDTIQEAEREASSWVFVPPGTYEESVEINTDGLTLQGCGYNTLIDSSETAINVFASNVTLRNFSAQNTSNGRKCVVIGDDGLVDNITVRESTGMGIELNKNSTVVNSRVSDCQKYGIHPDKSGCVVMNCIVESISQRGIVIADKDAIISNNIVKDTELSSIYLGSSSNNSICIGNRVISSDSYGINNGGNDSIIANNRISDSTDADIDDSGSGTLEVGNLTGGAN